jgi:hypothetical protein
VDEPIIADSALKHGVGPDAILHACRNPIRTYDVDDGFNMLIGPAPDADLLEAALSTEPKDRSLFTRCAPVRVSSIRGDYDASVD